MIFLEMMNERIGIVEAELKAKPEGRAILELIAHDMRVQGIESARGIGKLELLARNLATFITGFPVPTDRKARVDLREILWKHPSGAKIIESSSKKVFGIESNLDLMEHMAHFVVTSGRSVVTSSAVLTPAVPLPSATMDSPEYLKALESMNRVHLPNKLAAPTTACADGSEASSPAFPDAVAAIATARANGGFVGPMILELASISVADMQTPKPDASPADHRRHYYALVASGEAMRAGRFYQRHRSKILEAAEE